MNEDLALISLATCIKSARDIGDLARLIPSDDKDIKIGVASSFHQIHKELNNVVFDRFPSLKDDMERRLEGFGRFI